MTSLSLLQQEAAALGITMEEAKKYGNIRHKRTWSLAIEHKKLQTSMVKGELSVTTPLSPGLSRDVPAVESSEDGIPAWNLADFMPRREETAVIPSIVIPSMAANELKAENSPPVSPVFLGSLEAEFTQVQEELNTDHDAAASTQVQQQFESLSANYRNKPSDLKTVVQNHIKALQATWVAAENPLNFKGNWQCPECDSNEGNDCYLCEGSGQVDGVKATGWTLAWMELLGCSLAEIMPLRTASPNPDLLVGSFSVCMAIKHSSELLTRTERWVLSRGNSAR